MNLPNQLTDICPYCGEKFESAHGVRTHASMVHADDDTPEHAVNLAATGAMLDRLLEDIEGSAVGFDRVWSADTTPPDVLSELIRVNATRVAAAANQDPDIGGGDREPNFGYDDRGYAAEDRFGID